MKLRMRWLLTLLAGVTLGAAGCTSLDLHRPGGGESVDWTEIPGDVSVGASFSVGSGMTEVFLTGSGSCPPIIEAATVTDDGDHYSLVVDLEKYPENTACTEDLGFYGFQFQVEVGSVLVKDPNTGTQQQLPQMK